MNFAFENYRMLKRLSDFQLSRLLIRVSARENTKDLDISGCALIRGSGLTPLRNSRVLEQINLYATGADENPTPFLSTLRTMMPHALVDVVLSNDLLEPIPLPAVADFFHSLQVSKMEKFHDVPCSSCNLPVMDSARQLVPNINGNSSFHCYGCKNKYCMRPNCLIIACVSVIFASGLTATIAITAFSAMLVEKAIARIAIITHHAMSAINFLAMSVMRLMFVQVAVRMCAQTV